MPSASRITMARARPGRTRQSSAPSAQPGLPRPPKLIGQVNASGEAFWGLGDPACAGTDPHPYPDLE